MLQHETGTCVRWLSMRRTVTSGKQRVTCFTRAVLLPFSAIRCRSPFETGSVSIWRRSDPSTSSPTVEAPVLFVHGDADTQVPPRHSERMHELRLERGLPSGRWVLPGGEHGFDNYPPEGIFWNRILDFFDKALGGAPLAWELS